MIEMATKMGESMVRRALISSALAASMSIVTPSFAETPEALREALNQRGSKNLARDFLYEVEYSDSQSIKRNIQEPASVANRIHVLVDVRDQDNPIVTPFGNVQGQDMATMARLQGFARAGFGCDLGGQFGALEVEDLYTKETDDGRIRYDFRPKTEPLRNDTGDQRLLTEAMNGTQMSVVINPDTNRVDRVKYDTERTGFPSFRRTVKFISETRYCEPLDDGRDFMSYRTFSVSFGEHFNETSLSVRMNVKALREHESQRVLHAAQINGPQGAYAQDDHEQIWRDQR